MQDWDLEAEDRVYIGKMGRWPARAIAKSLVWSGHLSTTVVVIRVAYPGCSVAIFESAAGIASLDDVAVRGQAIAYGHVLIKLAGQMAQQLPAELAERQVAECVDDNDVMAQQSLCQPFVATGGLLLLKLIDQVDQTIE